MISKPEAQHEWLRRFVGNWENEAQCVMEPGKPPMTMRGTESVRMLGDLWVIMEGTSQMPDGGTMNSILTLGYDPAKAKFVGTWVGSPMASMFVYEGQLDAKGVVLPLNTTGPSFTDPKKMASFQDVIELHSDDRRVLYSQIKQDDGSWMRFMTVNYRRVK